MPQPPNASTSTCARSGCCFAQASIPVPVTCAVESPTTMMRTGRDGTSASVVDGAAGVDGVDGVDVATVVATVVVDADVVLVTAGWLVVATTSGGEVPTIVGSVSPERSN